MSIGSDTVETEDLARHVEAGHLGAPILEKDSALEEADTHRVEGIERASHTEQALGALHALAGVGDVLEQIEVGGGARRRGETGPVGHGCCCHLGSSPSNGVHPENSRPEPLVLCVTALSR